jgi:hypothetical protein
LQLHVFLLDIARQAMRKRPDLALRLTGSGRYEVIKLGDPQPHIPEPIRKAIAEPDRRVYPVLDGALFDDVSALLAARRVAHRSLFIKSIDYETVRVGPWLANPYSAFDATMHGMTGYALQTQPQYWEREANSAPRKSEAALVAQLSSIVDVARARSGTQLADSIELPFSAPAAVFWSGGADLTEQALWHHLRTINKVRIADRREGSAPGALEWVIFRHCDPNVLAQTLPALDEAQFARFLGPADSVLFLPDGDYTERPGWQQARRYDGLPAPGSEPLTINESTLTAIEERRSMAIRRGVERYVREDAARALGPVSDSEIVSIVETSEISARELGIKSAENRKAWAWANLATGGAFSRDEQMREHLLRPDADHGWDMATLKVLVREMLRQKREQHE